MNKEFSITATSLMALFSFSACSLSQPEVETPQVVQFNEDEGLEFLVMQKNGKVSAEVLTKKTTHLTAK